MPGSDGQPTPGSNHRCSAQTARPNSPTLRLDFPTPNSTSRHPDQFADAQLNSPTPSSTCRRPTHFADLPMSDVQTAPDRAYWGARALYKCWTTRLVNGLLGGVEQLAFQNFKLILAWDSGGPQNDLFQFLTFASTKRKGGGAARTPI